MSERSVAARYAKSVLDLAVERGTLEKITADMELVYRTGKACPELRALLRNPIVQPGKKLSIIQALFASKVDPLTLGFLEILVRKERAEVLYPASEEYLRQVNFMKRVLMVEITTAVPLSATLRDEILEHIKPLYPAVAGLAAHEIQVKEIVDPEIIGGFILRVEDKQIDSSLRRKLQDMKKNLVNNSFVKSV